MLFFSHIEKPDKEGFITYKEFYIAFSDLCSNYVLHCVTHSSHKCLYYKTLEMAHLKYLSLIRDFVRC